MKTLLLTLLVTITLQAGQVLLPLVSKHYSTTNAQGDSFNEFNYGIGYKGIYKDKKDYSTGYLVLALKDSYSHLMVIASVNMEYRLTPWLSTSVDAGVTYRKLRIVTTYNNDTSKTTGFKYGIMPILAPSITTKYNHYSVTLTHIPQVKDKVEGVTLLTLGIKL